LLDQQGTLARAGTFARDGDSIDTSADDHNVEVLTFQRWPRFDR
jgi:hypothetical protein